MPPKHHYLAEFYLKRWAGADGRLCEYAYRWRGVVPRMTHPGGTAYQRGLYSVPHVSPELTNVLEDHFFKVTDQLASDALAQFEQDGPSDMSKDLRSGWSRFIRSIQQRTPERLAWLKEECRAGLVVRHAEVEATYASWRLPNDPPTFEDASRKLENENIDERLWAIMIQKVIDSPEVGSFINRMRWNVLEVRNTDRSFLTSDAPVVMTNGIAYADSAIALPIGPRRLFVAVNNEEADAKLRTMDPSKLITFMNDHVVRQAQRFVYGENDCQLRFVTNRLRRLSADQS